MLVKRVGGVETSITGKFKDEKRKRQRDANFQVG